MGPFDTLEIVGTCFTIARLKPTEDDMSILQTVNAIAVESQAETRALSPLQRLGGIIWSPRRTFKDIARQPDWIWPVALCIVVALASHFASRSYVARSEGEIARHAIEQRLARQGRSVSDLAEQERQQIDAQVQMAVRLQRATPVILILFLSAAMAFLALLYWAGTRLVDGSVSYVKVLSVTAYAFAVVYTGLPALLKTGVGLLLKPDEPEVLRSVSAPSPAMLMPSETPRLLVEFLARADVFTIWFLILVSVGLATVSRKARLNWTALLTFGLWALSVAFRVAWTVLLNR